jgi:hypothetical protein
MRWLIAFALAAGALGASGGLAAPGKCRIEVDLYGNRLLVCDDAGGDGEVRPIGTGPDVQPVPQWDVVFGPEGTYCIARTGWMDLTGLGPTEIENLRAFANNTYDTLLVYGFLPCPGVEVPVTPTAWILQYIRAVPLPVPVPEIEPGEMLVGLEAFLETGSLRTHVIDDTSPFGPVHVELTSEVHVLWGDDTVTDWTTAPDGPYPDGEITHVWTRQGAYDVVVTQRWVASWSVGDESGIVRDGLTTEGTLADFPVEEVEAVVVG